MLFVRDKGRLCNNILQYGHVYAWGREHGRSTMSMRFAYKYQYFKICHTAWHWFWVYALAKMLGKIRIIPTIGFYNENDDFTSAEQRMKESQFAIVEGWYVRYYDLFLKYKKDILELFAFNNDITSKIHNRISSGKGKIRLGVHVRRGDYKNFKGGIYHYDDDTYIRFIKSFISLHPTESIDIYICGNDPSLNVKAYYNTLESDNTSVYFPNGNPGEDLCLLSECHYLIGPPSTFSLVASMYHDIPLLWMLSNNEESVFKDECWGRFDKLFKEII